MMLLTGVPAAVLSRVVAGVLAESGFSASAGLAVTIGISTISILLLAIWFWASLSLQVKRWHDLGHSGWMVLILLIPIMGSK
jgi:uncharacterized membrane protein YhaH (DUF805 family)